MSQHGPSLDAGPASHRGIEVAGEPVHAVDNHGVTVTDEPQQLCQLWPCGVPARGLVSENAGQDLALELAQFILVYAAHPQVADALTIHDGLQFSTCENECQPPR
jgi:hypothetical protein